MSIGPGGKAGLDIIDIKTVRKTASAQSQNVATIVSSFLLLVNSQHKTLTAIHASVTALTGMW
jgi:hypothetical protein